ncbi:hypothetical protein D1816_05210 [Aquimarina sp. AD10]|uniref:Transporter n=1 Tax=Aquimarina aggregata TaxID=1642818 RepID=A0A163CAZ7_9FLAO|nr:MULTISPECIES: DUF6733 family protein [Aquimarina]AXT59780.1 hypothetical protein D1816_05210 [Aquimarina sp. AD10]KZS42233.1 hypothetical protein AWE51_01975 [Aquimarina aggregata]RKM97650.1 hypothetical protein D7033_13780 [Aquimarina sp. AD10]
MKKYIILILISILTLCSLNAQETEEENKATFATKIIHNSVAGFYPIFFGNFETNKNYDITFYTIFWTNPAFGNLQSGSDLLLETSVGLGFKFLNNSLYVNPSFGITSGKFSSNSTGTKIAEGVVPSLYINYQKGLLDFEGYIAYYKSIREDDDIITKDYLLNWMAPGINVNKRIVLGAFYESFGITRQEDADPLLVYQWLGGSVKLKFDKGIAFRISAGATLNTDAGTSDEFYKVSAFIPL